MEVYPPLQSLLISQPIRVPSFADLLRCSPTTPVSNEAMVDAYATTWSCCCCMPCFLSILRACIDEAQVVKRWSRWSTLVILELMTTPRTLMEDTLSVPCITGRAGLEYSEAAFNGRLVLLFSRN